MIKDKIQNIILVVLSLACIGMGIYLFVSDFSLRGLFFTVPITTTSNHTSPHLEVSSPLIISSARVAVNTAAGSQRVYLGNLEEQDVWQTSTDAISRLIEEGDFERLGIVNDDAFLRSLEATPHIWIQYNFPMPATFFREFHGSREGFLSSHFDSFNSLIITKDLDFIFIEEASDIFFVFSLDLPPLAYSLEAFFGDILEVEADDSQDFAITYRAYSPIGTLNLASVAEHIRFLFPAGDIRNVSQAPVNNILTYSDGQRTVRFFPDSIVEYVALLDTTRSHEGFAPSLLVAFDMIVKDKEINTPKNHIILSGYSFDDATGRYHFYFDYVRNNQIINIDDKFARHPLEVHVARGQVVYYRRLMLYFYDVVEIYLENASGVINLHEQ
ncbi:MAG: hypothetical protein FWC69_01905 [Defluviitaleaceae bacterium]|nr:hypothetical protein [Defluviitaleaceae bacterium]